MISDWWAMPVSARPRGVEDPRFQAGFERPAFDPLDDPPEQQIVAIIIVEPAAGRGRRLAAAAGLEQRRGGHRPLVVRQPLAQRLVEAGDAVILLEPGRMIEQMVDGDPVGALAGIVRQIGPDRRVEPQPALVDQLQHQGRGEALGDRCHPVAGVRAPPAP